MVNLLKFLHEVCFFQERPQLENQRSELLESISNDLQFLRDLEDKSLGLLQSSQGKYMDRNVTKLKSDPSCVRTECSLMQAFMVLFC